VSCTSLQLATARNAALLLEVASSDPLWLHPEELHATAFPEDKRLCSIEEGAKSKMKINEF
jgi:hypothetical protein